MRTITREIVSALLLSKDGKIFFGKKDRDSGDTYAGCWHIPGGGVEAGETNEQALKREILEETGIDISSEIVELVDDQGTGTSKKTLKDSGETVLCEMHFNVYKVVLDKNADEIVVHLSSELSEYQWVGLDKISEVHKTPPGEEFFARFDINKLKQ